MLATALNVFLMILGFGIIIAVHELGHFLAARWAGIRVHAFAVGFGSALVSWRKGLGFRRGSSEPEYRRLLAAQRTGIQQDRLSNISPTEYRLNWFPFGGYVKMLGQEDLSPTDEPTAPDSFTAKPVWKRMIVISAGVVMNLLLAGLLFFIAFKVGIMELRPVIGDLAPDQPAEQAGLLPGDLVLTASGDRVHTFNDLAVAAVFANESEPLVVTVQRDGEDQPRTITITPRRGANGTYQIGAFPAPAPTLWQQNTPLTAQQRDAFQRAAAQAGAPELRPGMRLVAVNGTPLPSDGSATALPLRRAIERSEGRPVSADFADEAGAVTTITIHPRPALQRATFKVGNDSFPVRHLLGLAPVMTIENAGPEAVAQGIRSGDIVAAIDTVQWPTVAQGVAAIRANRTGSIPLTLLRDGALININARVETIQGVRRIGFAPGDTAATSTLLASPPRVTDDSIPLSPAARLIPGIVPGSRVTHVNAIPVRTFADIRAALHEALAAAQSTTGGAPITVALSLELPPASGSQSNNEPAAETVLLSVTRPEAEALVSTAWEHPQLMSLFDFAEFLDVAAGPVDAVAKGIAKTHNVIKMTYATFLALFERQIPVSQLQGPVGITHLGSRVAERGFIYLLFFLGLISANLAVVNFLPLPITDGGHMVFLAIEAVTRKPVSIAVQNVATIVGLVIIGTVFVVVTFHDIARLLGFAA